MATVPFLIMLFDQPNGSMQQEEAIKKSTFNIQYTGSALYDTVVLRSSKLPSFYARMQECKYCTVSRMSRLTDRRSEIACCDNNLCKFPTTGLRVL